MEGFFNAQSVAVIGVSESPDNLGQNVVLNLMGFGYRGLIYLVGPRGGAFLGHKIYPSVRDLPEPVDLANILVPAVAVPDILRQCGEKGIKRVIVQTGGFRELGEDRIPLEDEIKYILKRFGMRMIGPNCLGVINRSSGLAVPFAQMSGGIPFGPVAVISQSGGVGGSILAELATENIGFSKFASIGNRLDVNEIELLEYLIYRDDQTKIIFCYLEGIAGGRKLMEIAARSPKPVIIHKANRGEASSVIARSHSASLSTNDRVVDGAFKQSGILRVSDFPETIRMLKSCLIPPCKGSRIAIISRSGGHAVMAADAADEFGFTLPPYPEELIKLVEKHSRARVIHFTNPMDLGDLFDLELYKTIIERNLAREDIDGVVFIHTYSPLANEPSRELIVDLEKIIEESSKPLVVCLLTTHQEFDLLRREVSYPVFCDPREALWSLANTRCVYAKKEFPFGTRRPHGIERGRAKKILEKLPDGPIPPSELAEILGAYGIKLVAWEVAATPEQVVKKAHQIGFPVVLKTAEPEVLHKTEMGGVVVNIENEQKLLEAYSEIARLGPSVMVQKMFASELEWLVGGRQDENFGPIVVTGLGGIYVEVFGEPEIRVGPLTRVEASKVIDNCKGSALLDSVRGRPALDREALIDVLVRVSWLLADCPEIAELDLNPVGIGVESCYVLDWRATKRDLL